MKELIGKAAILMEALPYIQRFRDSIVVVKFGGSIMESRSKVADVLRDIVFMECAGMRPVIVHGGGKAISAKLAENDVATRFIQGLRYTDGRAIRVVDEVLHEVNSGLVETMRQFDGRPYALSGKSVLRADPIGVTDPDTGRELDLGFVGNVVNVDTEQLRWVLNRRQVPVITPLGRDLAGKVYNINADMAACRIAADLQAQKLVFLSDVPGILRVADDPDSLMSTIRMTEIDPLIGEGVIHGGMVPKVRSAADALIAGTEKVHMIDGRIQHSLLLEIFTDRGIGTQITH